jgi:hypothetical protein
VTSRGDRQRLGYQDFAEWIGEIEQRLPVATWKLSGVDVWPMVRLNLYHRNFNPASTSAGPALASAARRLRRELMAWLAARITDRSSESEPGASADAVFLAYSVGAQHQVAGKKLNPLLAPYVSLVEDLGKRANVWEMSPFGEYNTPRHTLSSLIQPWIFYERARASAVRSRAPELALSDFRDFAESVSAVGLSSSYLSPFRLAEHAAIVRRLADRFGRWLGRSGASVGFIADYGLAEHAFCLACREAGIPSVEIQHGIQGPLHGAYAPWRALPRNGFNTRPNGYWCWDQAAADTINGWARAAGIWPGAFVGGDAWFEMWSDLELPEVRSLRQELFDHGAEAPGIDILLSLTSSGEILPFSVVDALRDSPPDWRWWPRLHPSNQTNRRPPTREILRPLGVTDARMEVATSTPLPGLLRQMDVQVVIGPSTVIMQAGDLGVPSIAVGVGAGEAPKFFPDQARSGALTIAESGADLLDCIRRAVRGVAGSPSSGTERARSTMRWLLESVSCNADQTRVAAQAAAGAAQ